MLCSSSDKRESAVSAMASSRPPPIQPLKERGLGLTVPSTGRDRLFIELTGGPAPDAEGAWGRLTATGPTSALKCTLGCILARPLSHIASFAMARVSDFSAGHARLLPVARMISHACCLT